MPSEHDIPTLNGGPEVARTVANQTLYGLIIGASMSKGYTRATRMAATFLAKQSGADAAATAFGIDPRTIRAWLKSVVIPEDQWTAIRDVLLARGAEMAALGKTAGLPAVLTGAGISDRNVRYGTLIARREARHEEAEAPPEPNPMHEQMERLDMRRKRLLADELRHVLARREAGLDPTPAPEPERDMDPSAATALVDELLAHTDAEIDARYEELAAEKRQLDLIRLEREAEADANRPRDRYAEAVDVTPPPAAPVPRPSRSIPMLIDTGSAPDTWHELERRDAP